MNTTQLVVVGSIDEDIFVCGSCKIIFNCLNSFLNHKKSQCKNEHADISNKEENVVGPNSCTKPNTQLGNETMTMNNINHKEPDSITCTICKKTFKKMNTFLVHVKTHNEKAYQCPICGRCFIQNSHLQRHITSHKVWPDGLNKTTPKSVDVEILSYSCSYCDFILHNYSQFRAHLKKHMSLKKFKCIQGECTNMFDTIENLLYHVSGSHKNPKYICNICNNIYDSLEQIATHQQSHNMSRKQLHHAVKEYKCSQCDAVFRKPEKLSLHMLTENHEKTCIHCNKSFASDKRLRLHLQIHRRNKPYECSVCGNSFHMKKYLSSHMLKHSESQYSCSICKHKFKRKDLLHRHSKIHQIRKKFKCPFRESLGCKKEFSRSDKLKCHAHQFRVTDQVFLDISSEDKPLGRVVIGLFGDLAPKAVDNFKTLATKGIEEKSYKGTHFIRIIKRFMVQGGDVVNNDGTGSISVYGETFEDENLDTQHTTAGFVSMANKGLLEDRPVHKPVMLMKIDKFSTHPFRNLRYSCLLRLVKCRRIRPGYTMTHLKYGFIALDDQPQSVVCFQVLSEESMKPSKLLLHLETRHVALQTKPLEFFERKNTNGCQFLITTTGTPWLDNLHTVIGKVVEGQNVVHMVEHIPTDAEDRPTRQVYVADCGLLPTQPYYISDDPYDLWAWIKASAVPLTMSFSILGFFHWMIKKMEI